MKPLCTPTPLWRRFQSNGFAKQRRQRFFLPAVLAGLVLAACKTAPVIAPRGEPSASLAFAGVKADAPERLSLDFVMEIKNPVPSAGRGTLASWRVEIDGRPVSSGVSLESPAAGTFPFEAAKAPSGAPEGERAVPAAASFPLRLKLDMAALAADGFFPAADCEVGFAAELDFSFDAAEPAKAQASCVAAFPLVRPPVFSIEAIAILKAELINTRFRVSLRIDNPNPFPMELSAFAYELYGNGRLWADGTEKNAIPVPAGSSVSGDLFLRMNFINMKRDLLDQIIRLDDVNYRFEGEARVSSGVEYLPEFLTAFDLSGYSKVYGD